ncbi:hypothetical protein L7F22_068530 [Adiantum nelumboides]|nr:hypothetical protein [Adiantum nelumboides]
MSHRLLWNFSQKYGPIVGLRLGQQVAVAISSPDLAKEVLLTHDKIFANRPPFQFNELLLWGQNSDIIFSTQCPQWRKQKKICTMGLFTARRLQELEFVKAAGAGTGGIGGLHASSGYWAISERDDQSRDDAAGAV